MKKKYFILSALFLFNPVISIIDVFPDMFGYLFLMLAFKEASYIYDNAYDAYTEIRKLFLISCGKLACVAVLPFTDATMALVFSFSFGIAEAIFAISAFSKLFGAVDYISLRCNVSNSVKCEKMKIFTIAFTIFKLLMAFLPDLTSLSGGGNIGSVQILSFRSMFFVISSILALAVGTVWLVKFIKFSNTVLKKDVLLKISENFGEQMSGRKTVFLSRDSMSALMLIFAGSFFLFDFNFEGSNILPDCIFSAFVLISYLFMYKKRYIKYDRIHILFFISVAVHIISCALEIAFERMYLSEYDLVNAVRVPDAMSKYIPVIVFASISSITFVFIIYMTLKMIKITSQKVIAENKRFYSESNIDGFIAEYGDELKKKNIISLSFGVLLAVVYILSVAFSIYNSSVTVLNSIAEVAFIFLFAKNIFYVYDAVYAKMLKYS